VQTAIRVRDFAEGREVEFRLGDPEQGNYQMPWLGRFRVRSGAALVVVLLTFVHLAAGYIALFAHDLLTTPVP
jgi:hypothetical protein